MTVYAPIRSDVQAEDITRCGKCGARSYHPCNRYRLQRPVTCPREAMGDELASALNPDRPLGEDVCHEALHNNHDRFGGGDTGVDERVDELNFDTEEYRP